MEASGHEAVIRTIPEVERRSLAGTPETLGFFSTGNIYEVHAGSWKRNEDGSHFAQLKRRLDSLSGGDELYMWKFMPLMAHPLGQLGLSAYGLLRL